MGRVRRVDVGGMIYHALNRAGDPSIGINFQRLPAPVVCALHRWALLWSNMPTPQPTLPSCIRRASLDTWPLPKRRGRRRWPSSAVLNMITSTYLLTSKEERLGEGSSLLEMMTVINQGQ